MICSLVEMELNLMMEHSEAKGERSEFGRTGKYSTGRLQLIGMTAFDRLIAMARVIMFIVVFVLGGILINEILGIIRDGFEKHVMYFGLTVVGIIVVVALLLRSARGED
jgi:hypothetical protein